MLENRRDLEEAAQEHQTQQQINNQKDWAKLETKENKAQYAADLRRMVNIKSPKKIESPIVLQFSNKIFFSIQKLFK